MNILYKIGFLLLALIAGFMIITPSIKNENITTDIVIFGVGDADSILIKNKSKTILIDTGLKQDGEVLGDKLRTLGIKTIDYLILTHPDKDHIGGASYILDHFQVETLIQSKLDKGTKGQIRIKESLDKNPVHQIRLIEDYTFALGDLEVTIYAPKQEFYKKDNDYSLVTLIKDRQLNYLFAGDAEKKLLKEMIHKELPVINIYKVPHHGRWNNSSEEMIQKISPEFSVITNDRADEKVIKALKGEGSKIFYAFDQDIYFSSNGETIKFQ